MSSVCRNVIEVPNGDFIMIGLTYDSLNYFNYLTIVGTDSQGNKLWRKDYGNANFEYLDNMLSPRGAVFVEGNSFYYTLGVREGTNYIGALIKFNFNGDTLWQKLYKESYPHDIIVQGLTKSIDNGFLITGASQDWVSHVQPLLLIKTDINGNELWRKKISKAVPNVMDGNSIVQDSASKKIVIVGYQYIGSSTQAATFGNVLILDSLGNTLVQTTFNNAGGGFSEVIQLKDKNFLACGAWLTQQTVFVGRYNGLVVKFDTNGTVIWSKKYMVISPWSAIGFLNELENEDIMMLGASDPKEDYTDRNTYKLQLLRTDKNGAVKFKKYIGNSDGINDETSEFANCFNRTADKGYVIATGFQFLNSTHPYSIIKIDSTGCDTVEHWCKSVALGINNFTKLSGFTMELFPNPASSFVNLKMDAPQNNKFVVKLYDVSGRLLDEHVLETNNTLEINTSVYKAGVYFVSVFYEGRAVETKRLVVVR